MNRIKVAMIFVARNFVSNRFEINKRNETVAVSYELLLFVCVRKNGQQYFFAFVCECLIRKKYSLYENQIKIQTMERIRTYSNMKEDDCKSVTAILHDLYSENIETLQNRSVCGRLKTTE